MKLKRNKTYRKSMQLYCTAFKFREPYQLLVDAAFVTSCVQQKLDFQGRLQDVLQGAVKPMITQCCMQALYDAGAEGQGAVDLAKDFERRKCNHFKARPEDECMTAMAGKDNPNRYVVATQSLPLRKVLRTVPGLPIIYINRSIVLLETPSDQTMAKKVQMEKQRMHISAEELAVLNKTESTATDSTNLIDGPPVASTSTDASSTEQGLPKKKKRKGPKGPNPLSVKKKGKGPAETPSAKGAGAKVGEKRGREETGEEKIERKRKRIAEEQSRIVSTSVRGEQRATNGSGEGEEKKKRKRKRTKKESVVGLMTAVVSAGIARKEAAAAAAAAAAAGGGDGSAKPTTTSETA